MSNTVKTTPFAGEVEITMTTVGNTEITVDLTDLGGVGMYELLRIEQTHSAGSSVNHGATVRTVTADSDYAVVAVTAVVVATRIDEVVDPIQFYLPTVNLFVIPGYTNADNTGKIRLQLRRLTGGQIPVTAT